MLRARGVQRQHVSRPTSNLWVQGLRVPIHTRSRYTKATCPIKGFSAHSGLNCRTRGEPHLFGQFTATCPTSLHWIGGLSPPNCPTRFWLLKAREDGAALLRGLLPAASSAAPTSPVVASTPFPGSRDGFLLDRPPHNAPANIHSRSTLRVTPEGSNIKQF